MGKSGELKIRAYKRTYYHNDIKIENFDGLVDSLFI